MSKINTTEQLWEQFVDFNPILEGDTKDIAQNNMFLYAPYENELIANFDNVLYELLFRVMEYFKRKSEKESIFYCWFDGQARQLRFSFLPESSQLPFRREIKKIEVLSKIIELAISHWKVMYDLDNTCPKDDGNLYVYIKNLKPE